MPLLSRISCPAAGAVTVLIGMLCSCAPIPDPTPSPTPAFASEEQAFAAAEEVYREYNDAVNAELTGDAAADPSVYLTGSALETDIESSRQIGSQNVTFVGEGVVAHFTGLEAKLDRSPIEIDATACIDVSGTKILDSSGIDVTPIDRPTRVLLELSFVESNRRLLISDTQAAEEFEC
ncbi:hypothetical protein RAC69_02775 [Microbacterium sp. LS_15]|uniref:hypothetical protein n=1 Tax=Microbacterium sp. LS_15 TaxID=3055790 RepID=UPI0035BFA954